MSNPITPVWGWPYELENRAALLQRSLWKYHRWRQELIGYSWDPPSEIDPRPFWSVSDQGQMGSCQGNSLADACEICQLWANGEYPALSRNWAYYLSQRYDGLEGRDQGSTLEGGGRAAAEVGFVEEVQFPYSDDYASGLARFRSTYDQLAPTAPQWQMPGEVPLSSYDEIFHFLETLSGTVQIGIIWGLRDQWEHKTYSPTGGGHAVLFVGFLKVASWSEPGLLLANSWGKGWGRDGFGLCSKSCVDAMTRSRYNVFVGRSDQESPRPRPKPDL